MATKKASKKITKTAFILSLPRDLPAAETVEKAKAAGIKGLSETYVYKIRSRTKTAGTPTKGKPGPKPKGKGKVKTAPKKKAGKLSASDFIRKHPSKSANEIAALAKKAGIKMSAGLTYTIRAYDKKAKGSSSKTKGKPGPKSRTPKFQVFPGGGGGSEAELKKAALAVGFPRAREVVEELERGYMALLG